MDRNLRFRHFCSSARKTAGALLIAKGIGGENRRAGHRARLRVALFRSRGLDVAELGRRVRRKGLSKSSGAPRDKDTLILDSVTRERNGPGVILEEADKLASSKSRGSSYASGNKRAPRHQKFIDAMLASRLRINATMRIKAALDEGEEIPGAPGREGILADTLTGNRPVRFGAVF